MQRRSSFSLAVLAAALLLAGPGCGSGKPKLYKVSGKVTLDGQPLSGAVVQFVPADPASGLEIARGTTSSDGVYNLTTYNTNDGAMEGDYKVLITKSVQGAAAPTAGPMDGKNMAETMARNMKESFQGKTRGQPKNETQIHKNYSDLESTPLKVRVTAGANTADFPLKKDGGT